MSELKGTLECIDKKIENVYGGTRFAVVYTLKTFGRNIVPNRYKVIGTIGGLDSGDCHMRFQEVEALSDNEDTLVDEAVGDFLSDNFGWA